MWHIVIAFSCIKILLIPAYRSTDFEVHRNWLAITHSLPLEKWYQDDTSEWTLDYPPLFAYFEFILSQFAHFFDYKMLDVNNLKYASFMTVLFQKLSVIVTDIVLAHGIKQCISEINNKTSRKLPQWICFAYIFTNAALFIIDHIHFQYNGFLLGILLISFAKMIKNEEILAAIYFTMLLNLKHIYLYVAPAYFIYLLRSYVFSNKKKVSWKNFNIKRFLKLGLSVVTIFGISFLPFVVMGQAKQVFSRLFPFKRGLSHAYWAANFWAAYNSVDKVLSFAGSKTGLIQNVTQASMTGGLVQEFDHSVLPSISPLTTFVLTVCSMIPCLVILWRRPGNPFEFIRCVSMCGFCSFLFGWHVHEKAILLVTLPMSLISLISKNDAKPVFLLNVIGNYSVFPLIFTPHETPIKVTALLIHAFISMKTMREVWNWKKRRGNSIFYTLDILYLFGIAVVFIYTDCIHTFLLFSRKYIFLPFLMTSVYCCIGVLYLWIYLYYNILNFKIDFKLKTK